ncbi:ATP-binding response regulator [Ancylomarina longa]|uniref:histidine kinase n=1 Tax=Ancylomarina longa TaxID=2487017 RepID=A0A434AEX0_9BACT|nr:PAS domain-containing hybrid sensor histidine kinase/response regulator [Ancylomarina longa]RUT72961.1 PAS domain-containing hybrid sensor histidine kinase/response regulator [Ancylomarina longa]
MKLDTATNLKQLEKIQSIAGIGYWIYIYDEKNMWWSDVCFKILGYQIQEFTPSRKLLFKHIHPEDLEFFEESLHQMKSQAIEIEFRFYKNGELRLGRITGEVDNNDNSQLREEVLFQDITDIKIKEFEIAKAWNKALEAENLKNSFLANMSHELRTPLNSIIGFSELLETDNLNGCVPKYARQIKSSGLHLLKIIENLLKVSMLESRTAKPVKRNFNINKLLSDIQSNCLINMKNMKKEHLKLNFSCDLEDSLAIIKSDQIKIRSILQNILHNSIKFTEAGSITCSYKILNHTIQFSITDTGPGIPNAFKNKIFQRFRQVEENYNKNFSGTGLGLYISRLEIELLSGKIWMVSESDVGTTINFSIPNVIRVNSQDDVNPTPEIYNWENYTVVIAEDQLTNYKILEAYLQRTNINIIWAQTGSDVVKACMNHAEINLVLMDINLPHINGLEAAKRIKEKRPNLTIIAQTAYALEGDKEKSLTAGCSEHLAKPFHKSDLLLAMSKYLP